jgi:uncharacterized membrane protein
MQNAYEKMAGPEVWTGNRTPQDALSALVSSSLWPLIIGSAIVGLIFGICWSLFVAYPILVGRDRYFMESRQGTSPFGTLFSTFRKPYLNQIKVLFLIDLKIFAGYLLLIVPGILWSYEYMQVPYLLAENPYMSTARAMQLSKAMMQGEKWHAFVLSLSFLGWTLLCGLTFGAGFFFLEPYWQATFAELYAALRSKALTLGLTNSSELAGFMRYAS